MRGCFRVFAACVALAGCEPVIDQAPDDEPEEDSVMLDRSAPLDGRTQAVQSALCDEINAMAAANAAFVDRKCMRDAIADSQYGVACQTLYEQCLAAPGPACDRNAEPRNLGCPELTIGMFLDCVQEEQDTYAARRQAFTCETLLDDALAVDFISPAQSAATPTPACKAALDVCPGLFN